MGPSRRHDRLQVWSSCDSRVRVDFRSKFGTCRPLAGAQNLRTDAPMLTARLGRVSVTGRRNPCMMPTALEVLKAPTLLVDLRVGGTQTFKSRNAPPRVLDSKLRVTASPTRILGGPPCGTELFLKKAAWRISPVSGNRMTSFAEGCE
jgi:hypothetical protein